MLFLSMFLILPAYIIAGRNVYKKKMLMNVMVKTMNPSYQSHVVPLKMSRFVLRIVISPFAQIFSGNLEALCASFTFPLTSIPLADIEVGDEAAKREESLPKRSGVRSERSNEEQVVEII